jgi:riboflavin synthase
LVEEMGRVHSLRRGSRSAQLAINAEIVLKEVRLGDSIAVNGVCLTVTEFTSNTFVADVMAETLKRTNLEHLVPGTRVNLERALRLGDRLGGHIVSGHIDGVGVLLGEDKHDIARVFEIEAPPGVLKYIIEKGSIAVDGISLTVVMVNEKSFTVSLIPHTSGLTTLGYKRIGDTVNLEADIIGKYVERLLNPVWGGVTKENNSTGRETSLTLDFLAKNGFV